MEHGQTDGNFEEDKLRPDLPSIAGTRERKKYLQKTGKSLWMKNKQNKFKTVSLEVSTKSSDTSSFINSNYYAKTVTMFKNKKDKSISAFLDQMSIHSVDFNELIKKTIVTKSSKIVFLPNAQGAISKKDKFFTTKKVSNLWERRKQFK